LRLTLPVADAEALARHPAWRELARRARRVVAREAEADARLELRRGLRGTDADASAAADEMYRRRAERRKRRLPAPAVSHADDLARLYLECLNDMPAEHYLALEAELRGDANVTTG
jgi:hypothetical protein